MHVVLKWLHKMRMYNKSGSLRPVSFLLVVDEAQRQQRQHSDERNAADHDRKVGPELVALDPEHAADVLLLMMMQ
jgi:hypothetical protein